MVRFAALALLAGLSSAPAHATLLDLPTVEARVGELVMTADGMPVGRLLAVRPGPARAPICIVGLSEELRVGTSPLLVEGLHDTLDGLRMSDTAAALAAARVLALP